MKNSRVLLALFFIAAGVMHFVVPGPYLAIMPPLLPWPRALVAISGIAEIAGGLGVLFSSTRKLAAVGLVILLVAVFPANIYAAMDGMLISGWGVPGWILWLRLPLQAVVIAWVYLAVWKEGKTPR